MAVHFPTWIDEAVEYARECMRELPGTMRCAVHALRYSYPRVTMFGSFDKAVQDMDDGDLERCIRVVQARWPHKDAR